MNTSYCWEVAEPLYKAVPVYYYEESGPESGLAQGEAIKLFSVFYNEEKRGNEVFTDIEVGCVDEWVSSLPCVRLGVSLLSAPRMQA